MTGRHQPRRDYASGQCLAMLRRGGVGVGRQGEGDRQRWVSRRTAGRATTENMETKAKGDGKRRERENTVKKRQQRSSLLIYGWALVTNLLISTTLRLKLDQLLFKQT